MFNLSLRAKEMNYMLEVNPPPPFKDLKKTPSLKLDLILNHFPNLIRVLTIVLLLLILFAGNYVWAIEESETFNATKSLQLASEDMWKMNSDGINIEKYNDTLSIALKLNEALISSHQENDTVAVGQISSKLRELRELKLISYKNYDELKALKNNIRQSNAAKLDILNALYADAEKEFLAGRFDNSLNKIDLTYAKLIELEATETKLKIIYESAAKSIEQLLIANWVPLMVALIVVILLALLLTPHFKRIFISNKIEKLNTKAEAIKVMIKETQEEYFDKGAISESMYHTRIRKYGELLREVHREIPLMKESYLMQEDIFTKLFRLKGGEKNAKSAKRDE